jgi:ubiquitin carboxyl-terminal hydrolase 7
MPFNLFRWDSRQHTGFIGMVNQGATCYLNALIQTLFFTTKLRESVYLMPTEEDDPNLSIALGMQRTFYELQVSNVPVDTKKLTISFGWKTAEGLRQHDVQELSRLLLDTLEEKMRWTAADGTIRDLFCGTMRSYIRCLDVNFESSREEQFYDVQLNVEGNASSEFFY